MHARRPTTSVVDGGISEAPHSPARFPAAVALLYADRVAHRRKSKPALTGAIGTLALRRNWRAAPFELLFPGARTGRRRTPPCNPYRADDLCTKRDHSIHFAMLLRPHRSLYGLSAALTMRTSTLRMIGGFSGRPVFSSASGTLARLRTASMPENTWAKAV